MRGGVSRQLRKEGLAAFRMKRRILAAMTVAMLAGCVPSRSTGTAAVSAGNKTVYFVREVRGMNYDSLALSPSPDPCQDTDSDANYVFVELGPVNPYYRWDGSALHLFHSGGVESPVTFPVPVILHELGPLEWQELERTAPERGLSRVDVAVDGSCSSWF